MGLKRQKRQTDSTAANERTAVSSDGAKENKIVGSVREGLFGALASALMGIAALVLMLAVSMNVIAELLCLYGLILGVRAIGDYKVSLRLQTTKPVPTLVLGIVGVVVNGVALVMWLYWIIGYFALIMME